jgi:hypothetical protein
MNEIFPLIGCGSDHGLSEARRLLPEESRVTGTISILPRDTAKWLFTIGGVVGV